MRKLEETNCTICGLCCQHISKVSELKEFDLGNGTCKYYEHTTKQCKIYDSRPDICKVDVMYDKRYYKEFSPSEYAISNASICNSLQEFYRLDKSYRILINQTNFI